MSSRAAFGRQRRRSAYLAYVIQGFCVAVAAICYCPASARRRNDRTLWELQASPRSDRRARSPRRAGRIGGTWPAALILEVIANVMVLSDMSRNTSSRRSGAIIIIACWRTAFCQPLKTAPTSKEEKMKSIIRKAGLLLSTGYPGSGSATGHAQAREEDCRACVNSGPANRRMDGRSVYHAEQAEKESGPPFQM